jgi:hypothetical protein
VQGVGHGAGNAEHGAAAGCWRVVQAEYLIPSAARDLPDGYRTPVEKIARCAWDGMIQFWRAEAPSR